MQTATNYVRGCIKPLTNIEPAHPRNDDRVEFVNTTEQNRRGQGKVLFSHADHCTEDHKRSVDFSRAVSGHRTTFHVYDIDAEDSERRNRFNRMWKYQVGRGHTWADNPLYKHTVRDDATWKRCDAILQNCEVPSFERELALRTTLSERLHGFSRHYNGADGACIGFALIEMFDSPKAAKGSWVAKNAADDVPGFDPETVNKLIEYVFRKYDRIE